MPFPVLTDHLGNFFRKAEIFTLFLFKDFIYFLRERGREGERDGEKHQCVVASHMPLMGTWPATWACALNGNRTCNPLVRRLALNPLSHTSQGNSLPLRHQNYKCCSEFFRVAEFKDSVKRGANFKRAPFIPVLGSNLHYQEGLHLCQ